MSTAISNCASDTATAAVDLETKNSNTNIALEKSCRRLSTEIFEELNRVTAKLEAIKSDCSELRNKLDDSFGKK